MKYIVEHFLGVDADLLSTLSYHGYTQARIGESKEKKGSSHSISTQNSKASLRTSKRTK